jgi:hypothetical protein
MSEEYTRVFTESQILVSRLQDLLGEKEIHSRIQNDAESGRLAGFGTPLNSSQLFILKKDLEKAKPIIDRYNEEINS